jgi:glutamine amidotransferase
MIGIINYEIGNLRSVEKALIQAGGQVKWVRSPGDLDGCQGLVLPGVGAFGDCIRGFRATGLWSSVLEWIKRDRPFLGICVGYQMLFESSEESPETPGLGIFGGRVVRFPNRGELKVPQIGWNQVTLRQSGHVMLAGIEHGTYYYFVHSYYPVPADPAITAMETEYGLRFASAGARGNLFATQFHPEKSQANGLRLLGNFVSVSKNYEASLACR